MGAWFRNAQKETHRDIRGLSRELKRVSLVIERLRRFGHVERKDDGNLAQAIYVTNDDAS